MPNSRSVTLVALFAIVAAAAIWQLSCGQFLDDIIYNTMPELTWPIAESPTHPNITSWSQIPQALWIRYLLTTSRLPNFIMTVAEMFPPQLMRVLNALMTGLMMLAALLLANGRKAIAATGWAGSFFLALWIILPFYDGMASIDFVLNYVWVSVFDIAFVYVFQSRRFCGGKWKWLPWAIAVLAGLSHEGFSLPIIGGALVLMICDPTDRKRRAKLLAVFTFCALLMLCNFGNYHRFIHNIAGRSIEFYYYYFIRLAINNIGLYILPIAAIIAYANRKRIDLRRWWLDNCLMIVAFCGMVCISVVTAYTGRSLWVGLIFALVVLARTLWAIWPSAPRWKSVIGLGASAVVVASLLTAAYYQRQLTDDLNRYMAAIPEATDDVVYLDTADEWHSHWLAMRLPLSVFELHRIWNTSSYVSKQDKFIPIFPKECQSLEFEQWPEPEGNTNLKGRYPIFASKQPLPPESKFLNVTFGEHTSAANPVYRLLSKPTSTAALPIAHFTANLRGDTIHCYIVDLPNRINLNRPIISIDYVNQP